MRKYKFLFSGYMDRHVAFRGRSFSFQVMTLVAVAASVAIIISSIYLRFTPKYKETDPARLTARITHK